MDIRNLSGELLVTVPGETLRCVNLRGANLANACLRGADLRGANLRDANLRGANLRDADLRGATLPAPPVVLLAAWGEVSPDLCTELMRYDAVNHPKPAAFDAWAEGGPCPYDGARVQRSARFTEDRTLWSPGPALSAFYLMVRVIREKCADSDYHEKKGE